MNIVVLQCIETSTVNNSVVITLYTHSSRVIGLYV